MGYLSDFLDDSNFNKQCMKVSTVILYYTSFDNVYKTNIRVFMVDFIAGVKQ